MAQAKELLELLGALDDTGRCTDTGRRMLAVPAHPRLARMVIDAGQRDQGLACMIATLLDERDILRGRHDELPTDLALRVRVVLGQAGHDLADRGAVERTYRRAQDMARRVGTSIDRDSIDPDRAGEVLILAYPDRLAVRRGQPGQFQLRGGSAAWMRQQDPLAAEQFVIAADVDGDRKRTRIRLAAGIDAAHIEERLGALVERRATLSWDKERNDIIERIERRLGSMVIDSFVRRPGPGEEATAALIERVRNTRLRHLNWTPAASSLRSRVNFARSQQPDAGWPDWSDNGLIGNLDDWLAPYLIGMTSITELADLHLVPVLRAGLPWPLGGDLDAAVPAELVLASGRVVDVDYSGPQPTVSARVQDLFGTKVHPKIGNHPVLFQLLSPADRPIQVTGDIVGFWNGSWAEVRKEMAGRYPKHYWPIDPSSAPPKRLKER